MKKTLLLLIAALSGGIIHAASLSPSEALARLSQDGPAHLRAAETHTSLAYTEMKGTTPTLYLFSRGENKGFLLLPADDNTAPLLGYSDTGNLPEDPALLPDGFRYWMNTLSAQVEINSRMMIPAQRRAPENDYPSIAPMVATRWNQSAPYNDECPEIGGKRSVTGCVATALAQILYYHKYPARGTGTKEYEWKCNYNGQSVTQNLSFDYGATEFDWDNMLEVYTDAATAEQNAAVAKLMYACGVAVNMNYSPVSSGAVTAYVPEAMVKYFGYDKGVRIFYRDYYGLDEWNEMVYNQLKDYGPVQYSGQSNDGGHSFVCDGYSANGYFHINWGWGGMSDGYFLLTALDPGSQGIGGSTSGYDFDQDIIGNVSIEQSTERVLEQISCGGNFSLSTSEQTDAPEPSAINVTLPANLVVYGGFYNYSAGTIPSFCMGVKLVPENGGEATYIVGSSGVNLEVLWGYKGYFITLPASLQEGTYTVTPAFRNSYDEWQDVPVPLGKNPSYTLVVESDGSATLTPKGEPTIEAADLTSLSPLYVGQQCRFSATLTNPGSQEFIGRVVVVFVTESGSLGGFTEPALVDILPGESTGWLVTSSMQGSGTDTPAGDYLAYVAILGDTSLTPISEPIQVTVKKAAETKLSISNFRIEDKQPSDKFTAYVDVECTSGYFFGTLKMYYAEIIPGQSEVSSSDYLMSPMIMLEATATRANAGEEYDDQNIPSGTTVEFAGALNNVSPDKEYLAWISGSQNILGNRQARFTVDRPTGVEVIDGNPEASPVISTEYFSLTGISYGDRTPSAGIYIVRRIHADGTVTTTREAL